MPTSPRRALIVLAALLSLGPAATPAAAEALRVLDAAGAQVGTVVALASGLADVLLESKEIGRAHV